MELGLSLIENGNNFRNTYKEQCKTFEMSSDCKIPIYFQRADDNIPNEKYSYARAAIHTSIELQYRYSIRECVQLWV